MLDSFVDSSSEYLKLSVSDLPSDEGVRQLSSIGVAVFLQRLGGMNPLITASQVSHLSSLGSLKEEDAQLKCNCSAVGCRWWICCRGEDCPATAPSPRAALP